MKFKNLSYVVLFYYKKIIIIRKDQKLSTINYLYYIILVTLIFTKYFDKCWVTYRYLKTLNYINLVLFYLMKQIYYISKNYSKISLSYDNTYINLKVTIIDFIIVKLKETLKLDTYAFLKLK